MVELRIFKSFFTSNFWRPFNRLPVKVCDLKKSEKDKLVVEVFERIQKRVYSPSPPLCNLMKNKGYGVVRIIPVFEASDYIVYYYYCIIRLEPLIAINRVKNTFGGWSLSGIEHRALEKAEIDEKHNLLKLDQEKVLVDHLGVSIPSYTFNPSAWSKIYTEFNARLFEEINASDHIFYADFDISNFYDSIRLDLLERKIRQRFDMEFEDDLNLLFHFLQYWNKKVNHYNKQSVGIPQDAMNDCSRILANFYLQEYDIYLLRECEKKGASYLRYCDDQFIFANSKQDLEYLVFKASIKLKALGLSLNQKKVHIDKVEHLIKARSFNVFDIIKEDADKQDLVKVEKFIDEILIILESTRRDEIKARGIPLLNRALFCCIEKMPISKKARLIAEYTKDEYLLLADSGKFKRIFELITDIVDRLSFLKTLNRLSEETVHNFFHYELLKFYTDLDLDGSLIQARIKQLAQMVTD